MSSETPLSVADRLAKYRRNLEESAVREQAREARKKQEREEELLREEARRVAAREAELAKVREWLDETFDCMTQRGFNEIHFTMNILKRLGILEDGSITLKTILDASDVRSLITEVFPMPEFLRTTMPNGDISVAVPPL